MFVSFTGSRKGMTDAQKRTFNLIMYEYGVIRLIHGDCIGSDKDAHEIACKEGVEIKKRPCNIKKYRAFTVEGDRLAPPEDPLVRNKKIVNDGEHLIACPSSFKEELRSGTWSTIRYGKSKDIPITIIWPDGKTSAY